MSSNQQEAAPIVESSQSTRDASKPLAGAICAIASLGCPKNLVDSESLVGRLLKLGAELAGDDAEQVDFFLLNTCGFLRSARAEAEEYVEQALQQKKEGAIRFLIVTGCAVVSDGEDLAEKFPDVDAWLSPFDEAKIGEIALELLEEKTKSEQNAEKTPERKPTLNVLAPEQVVEATKRFYYTPAKTLTLDDSDRTTLTAPHVAYLKIADGCDRFCTYCAIPNIRGRYVSKPLESIVEESNRLADQGVRELVLIAQETTFWGADLYGKPDLKRLLATLKEKNRFDWIRVLYTYPLFWDADLTALFKLEEPGTTSILPYVDVPLQHCNSELLRKMNRRVDKAQTEELLARFREEIPNVVLRTSLIVGFPGETERNYQELLDFVAKWKFERAGVFKFSAEPGTPAAQMENQVPQDVIDRRYERLYARQEHISRNFATNQRGKTLDVILDSRAVAESGATMRNVCIGRTYADAPDVDPVVYVTGRDLELGKPTKCEIVEAQGLDLIAVPVDPEKIFVSKEERREAYEREEAQAARAQGTDRRKKKTSKARPVQKTSGKGARRNGGK